MFSNSSTVLVPLQASQANWQWQTANTLENLEKEKNWQYFKLHLDDLHNVLVVVVVAVSFSAAEVVLLISCFQCDHSIRSVWSFALYHHHHHIGTFPFERMWWWASAHYHHHHHRCRLHSKSEQKVVNHWLQWATTTPQWQGTSCSDISTHFAAVNQKSLKCCCCCYVNTTKTDLTANMRREGCCCCCCCSSDYDWLLFPLSFPFFLLSCLSARAVLTSLDSVCWIPLFWRGFSLSGQTMSMSVFASANAFAVDGGGGDWFPMDTTTTALV